MILNCLFVGLGGFVGSVLRYLVSLIPLEHESGFPLVTLGINVLGAFLLGLIMAFGRDTGLDPRTLLFLKVGVCGGFTTFSTLGGNRKTDRLHLKNVYSPINCNESGRITRFKF